MTANFLAEASPAPCPDCGGALCGYCARVWGMTAVHFAPDGICAFGHQMKAEPAKEGE